MCPENCRDTADIHPPVFGFLHHKGKFSVCPNCASGAFPSSKIVRFDEVSLHFPTLVRGIEITPLGVGKERIFTEGLFGVVER